MYVLTTMLNSGAQHQCFGVCFFVFKAACLGLASYSYLKIKHLTQVKNLASLKGEIWAVLGSDSFHLSECDLTPWRGTSLSNYCSGKLSFDICILGLN